MTAIDDRTQRRTGGRSAQVAASFGVLCGAAWYAKLAVLGATDGAESGIVGGFWGLGLLSFLVASAAAAVALLRGRRLAWRIVGGVVAVPVAFTVFNAADTIAKSVYTDGGWFRDEVGLLIVGAVAALLGVGWLTSAFGGGRAGRP